jgi:hypothetical protein
MLNRPSTRIELKLEEDIIELDETHELRRVNFFKNQENEDAEYRTQFSPEPKQDHSHYQRANNNFEIRNTVTFTPKQDSSPLSEDISMR